MTCGEAAPELGTMVRTSPPMLSMLLQTVKFIVKKSKCAGLFLIGRS